MSVVSTHMPLARHDDAAPAFLNMLAVSTHMPLARHDVTWLLDFVIWEFLLTCLLRGMTTLAHSKRIVSFCFYSHASCEA